MRYKRNGRFVVDDTDACATCAHFRNCPIVDGLNCGLFFFEKDTVLNVNDCTFYKESTKLRVIDGAP